MKVFTLESSKSFGRAVAARLDVPLGEVEEREFEDGEHKVRPMESVRNQDVYVIQSLYGQPGQSVHDKLCRLLFLIGALKDAAAKRVTAVTPYLCYARKDRKTKSRDPVTTRYIACLLESVGTDRVVTLDVHNLAAFQNAFRCATEHLEAKMLFAKYFQGVLDGEAVAVISPDVGGVKRARAFADTLQSTMDQKVAMAFLEKYRSGGVVSGEAIVGDVRDRVAIIIDDLISSGTTIGRAASACERLGATRIFAVATHGLFVNADEVVSGAPLEKVIVTDSVPPFRLRTDLVKRKLFMVETAQLFAEAIRRIHDGGSIVDLMAGR